MLKGIHAVFKGMPLFWGRGYLDRALAVMERATAADVKLSKDTVRTEKCACRHLTRTRKIIQMKELKNIYLQV